MDEDHPPSGEISQGVGLPIPPQNQQAEAKIGEDSHSIPVSLGNDTISTPDQAPPVRRGRGRPRGSKNKKTIAAENATRVSRARFPSPVQTLDGGNDSHQSWMGDEYVPSNYGDCPCRATSTSRFSNENSLLSPDKYENHAVAEFIKDYRNSVHLTRENNRKSVPTSNERMKEEEQYELARLIDSHIWSQDQEDELGASWDNGLIKAAIQRLPDHGTYLSSVFKISLHLCNMDPLSLLSMYHDFEFDNSGSPVLARFRFHQERLNTAGVFTTPHAKLLSLIADQVGVRAVPTSTDMMLVRTGDLGVVISSLDSLNNFGVNISCNIHRLQYCSSRTLGSYPSGLEELLKAYKAVWTKFERRKLCHAAVDQPPTQGDMFYHQAGGPGFPANINILPNNAVLGGFPRNFQPVGHFEPENSPIRRLFNPDADGLTRTTANHRDQLNPFQAFVTKQPNRAQSNFPSPRATHPNQSPAQEPRMNDIEDGEVKSIESSDEGMLEDQPEQAPNVTQAVGGVRPRKRKGGGARSREMKRRRKLLAQKEKEHLHGHRGQPHSSAPQRQGGSQGGALHGMGNQPQPDSRFNPPTGPRAWRQQHGGHGPF
ncbi:hypothetical protein FGADI_3878 [Fusarium gaditjirri]|uniref:Uncharacterized protein n=1 Tax=Fusarium gaditjirri TaxID=282569 RepID=A0A8H4TE86_9HYPO|nr:hypothetical protein FGADI_3878 [Fusarium gaditjirri]